MFLAMMAFTIKYAREMYDFFKADFWPDLRTWWLTKGAAAILHQLGLWLFFFAFFTLVWVLDSKGLIWYK